MFEDFSWTVHRAKESRRKTTVAVVFIAAFVAFTLFVFGPVLALLAAVILFIALNAYFLPVTYTFSDSGIVVDKRLFKANYQWKQFRRWFRTTGGIVLSPFSRRTYLDNFRGVHLLLPEDPGAIVAYLERRFAPPPPDDRLKLDDTPAEDPSQESQAKSQEPRPEA